jgi:hypothetical protein
VVGPEGVIVGVNGLLTTLTATSFDTIVPPHAALTMATM